MSMESDRIPSDRSLNALSISTICLICSALRVHRRVCVAIGKVNIMVIVLQKTL